MSTEFDKKWSEMDAGEKQQVEDLARSVKKMSYKIVLKYNKLLYSWLFLINAGGLIVALAFLKSALSNNQHYLSYLIATLFFIVGIISIVWAVKLKIERFKSTAENLQNELDQFKSNKMTRSYLMQRIFNADYHQACTRILERTSFIVFLIGIFCVIFCAVLFASNVNPGQQLNPPALRQPNCFFGHATR